MEENKSIDGLVSRRSKKAPSKNKPKNPSTKKPPTKKTSRPKKAPSTPKTPVKTPPEPEPISDTINSDISTTVESPSEKTPEIDVTEDFLKPVEVFNFDEETGELKPTDNEPKKDQVMKKPKKKLSKKRKIIISIITTFILIIIGLIVWFVLWGNDIIAKITGGQGNVLDLIFQDENYEPLKTDKNGRTNILAFGTSGYDMNGEEKGGTHDGAQLTDSIMIISLNQETGDIAMLSVPRDLKASPTCTATGKINEVYWCNGGNGDISTEEEAAAAQALMNEVSSIFNIEFQYFVHVNWGSLVQIVDILDGITVTLDEDIRDYYYYDAGGTYTIHGDEALWLARMRYGTAHGDFSRTASQQKILIGLKDRIIEKSLSITELLSLASTLGDNLRSNFSIDELKTLAHLTYNYDFDNMRQISLIEPELLVTSGSINGISYVLPVGGLGYYTKLQDYVEKQFSNDPRTYEDSAILVLNSSDEVGVASTEKANLEEAGYTDIYIDDAPEGEYPNGYTLYTLTNTAPGTKKLLEEKYSQTAKSIEELPEGINQNYDFVLIIGNNSSKD